MRVAYPFRKISDGIITHRQEIMQYSTGLIQIKPALRKEISQAIEPSQSKPIKQPIVSAQAPNS